MRARRLLTIGSLSAALAAAGLLLARRSPASGGDEEMKAPELDGGIAWLNTDHPIHLSELRGQVVLLDFWTYC